MTTSEQINNLIELYGKSLSEIRIPNTDFAYEKTERKNAHDMAKEWQGEHYKSTEAKSALEDFICHQSDVIEILCSCLKWANKKLWYR